MRQKAINTILGKFFILPLLLLSCLATQAQRGTKPKDKKPIVQEEPKDSVSPPLIQVYPNCQSGLYGMMISRPVNDTLMAPQYFFIYLLEGDAHTTDSNGYRETRIKLENPATVDNPYLFFPKNKGKYVAKAAIQRNSKTVYSLWSDTVTISFCSKLEFPDVYDRSSEKTYHPPHLINIQIVAFDIFDRIGNPVYSHKSNDINWDGNYTDKQKCPAGVYYYHCEYIDLAADGEKKSLSGMIELKN